MKRSLAYLASILVATAILYLGYDLLKAYLRPCESIFQQTATQIGGDLETIQAKGSLFVGRQQVQELTERSQMLALQLKTCCTLSDQGILSSEDFLACKGNAARYRKQLDEVVRLIDEAEAARERGNTRQVSEKVQRIDAIVTRSESELESISKTVSSPSPETETTDRDPAPGGRADPVSGKSAEREPNDSVLEAQRISTGTTISAAISEDETTDYYRFRHLGEVRDVVEFEVSNRSTTLAPELKLYNQDKSEIFKTYDSTDGADLDAWLVVEPQQEYYVQFSGWSGSHGSYELSISGPLERYDRYEPNDGLFHATPISLGDVISANLVGEADEDWYRIEALGADRIRIRLENRSRRLKPQVSVYDQDKSRVAKEYNTTEGGNVVHDMPVDSGHTYYFNVEPWMGAIRVADYRLTISPAGQ